MTWLPALVFAGAMVASGARWMRIAQREHYLSGSVTRFMARWWVVRPVNIGLFVAAAAASIAIGFGPIALAVAIVGPVGFSVRGTTGTLAWTARLRRAASLSALLFVGMLALWSPLIWALPIIGPLIVDLALFLLRPIEERLGSKWVEKAAATLSRSGSRVVAITGSYGKTSTKGYLNALLADVTTVMASPASFNNRMGLARSVNEHLVPGTDVFIAEMGTYGPGEIRALCEWMRPDVGVITAIGPVHLERMRSEERIVVAKREILEEARVAVLNIDHPLLARIAAEEGRRREVITCSAVDPDADVVACKETGELRVGGVVIGHFDTVTVLAGNLACAVGAAIGLGFQAGQVFTESTTLPVAPHRLSTSISDKGFEIIDDTFNSNPAGARAALRVLLGASGGRRVLVTPGMVELGRLQKPENKVFAELAAAAGCEIIAVGRTNRRALIDGGGDAVIVLDTRPEAVAWVRDNLGPGDAVLYENDLPDHYP